MTVTLKPLRNRKGKIVGYGHFVGDDSQDLSQIPREAPKTPQEKQQLADAIAATPPGLILGSTQKRQTEVLGRRVLSIGQVPTSVQPSQQNPVQPQKKKVPKAPTQASTTQASVGQGVRRPKKTTSKTRLSDLRIRRPRINTALAISESSGTGLNVGGY